MTALLHAESLKARAPCRYHGSCSSSPRSVPASSRSSSCTPPTTEHTAVSLTNLATAAAAPLWFLAVVVAVLASAGEFQHRTIQPTLLQTPRRGRLLAAKTLVAAGYGAIITLLGTTSAGSPSG